MARPLSLPAPRTFPETHKQHAPLAAVVDADLPNRGATYSAATVKAYPRPLAALVRHTLAAIPWRTLADQPDTAPA